MKLNKLKIRNFRNLKEQEINFSKRTTIFTGRNGQGKTSILEAISVISHAKSFKTSKNKELINWNNPENTYPNNFLIEASIEKEDGSKNLTYQIKSRKKSLLVNNNKIDSLADYIGLLKSVEFIPEDLTLISGPPDGRRKFFDRLISQINPVYLLNLMKYQRSVKQRNQLLMSSSVNPNEINSWNTILAELNLNIAKERRENIEYFKEIFKEFYKYFSCFDKNSTNNEIANLEYKSSLLGDDNEILSNKEIIEKYKYSYNLDLARKRTSFGAHRDDYLISLSFRGEKFREAKNLASQGQKRSLALSLKFACLRFIEEKTGEKPLLLIDDIESELDIVRKEALFKKILELENQVILTTTEINKDLFQGNLKTNLKSNSGTNSSENINNLEILKVVDGVIN